MTPTASRSAKTAKTAKTATLRQNSARDARQARRADNKFFYEGEPVSEQQYWQLVHDEGVEVITDDGKDDQLIQNLLKYPISSTIWSKFYKEYILFIEENISDNTLRYYASDLTVKNIQKGYDDVFNQSNYELLLNRIAQYEIVMTSLKEAVLGTFNMSNISKDGLKHLLEAIDTHIKSINDIESDSFYSHLVTIVELMFDSRVFNAFMTGTHDGSTLTKTEYTAVWIRRAPIWGIGERSFAYGGLRNFIQNYFRKLVDYAKKHDDAYNLTIINPNRRHYGPLVGGRQEELDKESLDKALFYKIFKAKLKFREDVANEISKCLKKCIVTKTFMFNGIKLSTNVFRNISTKAKSAPL